jgi:adenylate cyclase
MFTDMIGYTALGQKNESLSLNLLEEQRNLVRPIINRHHGKEIKTIGDAFLIEFPSALDAVRCAYSIQRAAREFNIPQPHDHRIRLRIGIHLGDVIESQGDISGDAVNVASRIESNAEEGGVCVTRQVYDSVQNKFELPLLSIGYKSLKNVGSAMELFRISMPWETAMAAQGGLDKRRIAVLPLANFSPDSKDEYFADGMTEEIISTLSKVSGLRVISRTSVMRYKKAERNINEIARELNVNSILEGSVRRAGDDLRITVQLIDVESDEHLWSEDYDRKLEGVFAVQKEIAQKVSESLKLKLLAEDQRKIKSRPVNSEAFTLYLKALSHLDKRTITDEETALRILEKVLEIDPEFAPAYVALANCYIRLNEDVLKPEEALPKAERALQKALEIDEYLADAHDALGFLLRDRWDWAGAEREFRRAVELNPSHAMAHSHIGHLLYSYSRTVTPEILEELRKAEELSPLSYGAYLNFGLVFMANGQYDLAIEQAKKSLKAAPDARVGHLCLAYSYLGKGDSEQAVKEAELSQDGTAHSISHLANIYALVGRISDAKRLIGELEEMSKTDKPVMNYIMAEAYAGHDTEKTFELLEKSFEAKEGYLAGGGATSGPFLRLHRDPRYRALVKRMGLDWKD